MNEPSPEPKPSRGIVCPRCKGTEWRVDGTRAAAGRLVRVRLCVGCKLRVRTREMIEATAPAARPKTKLKPAADDAATTGNCC